MNNKIHITRKTKDEKRRLAFEKRNVKKEMNLVRYGAEGGSALVTAKTADLNRRFVAAFIALWFAISCIVIGVNFTSKAEELDEYNKQTSTGNGLTLSKGLKANGNGSYNIQLEAYSDGKTQTHTEQIPTDYVLIADQSGSMSTKDVPIGYDNGTKKDWKISDGAEAYYYKETDENGVDHYYRVYRKRGYMFEYHEPNTVYIGSCVSNLGWFQSETTQLDSDGAASPYWYNPSLDTSNKPIGNTSDNTFYPLLISSQGGLAEYWIRFRFTDKTGTKRALQWTDDIWYAKPAWNNEPGGYFKPGDRYAGVITYDFADGVAKRLAKNDPERYTYARVGANFPLVGWVGLTTGMYVRQVLFTRHTGYSQLAYRDDNGVEHLLIDATYCNSSGTPVGGSCGENGVPSGDHTNTTETFWNGTLYKGTNTITRLEALKAAMNDFIDTVSTQENDDWSKPDHRVAIVGFADGASASNTELLTGTNFDITTSSGVKSGIQYRSLNDNYYKNALLDVTDGTQLARLRSAVSALEANGGTQGEHGFYMAKNILDQRSVTKYTTKDGKEVDRLTIVVYFTDGTPGNYDDDNQYAYANTVVDAAKQLKTDGNIPNVEVYSIGTFGFADSEPLTYEKYSSITDERKFEPDYVDDTLFRIWLRNTPNYGDIATDTVYDYMRTITTEYMGATQFVDPSWYGTGTKSDSGNYVNMVNRVRGDSNGERRYFLCTDLNGLSRVFTTIASETSSSSTSIQMDGDHSYLFDELTNDFQIGNDSEYIVETFRPVFEDDGSISGWNLVNPKDPNVTGNWVSDDSGKKIGVKVEGFDYTGNYIAKANEVNAQKVRLTITNVKTNRTNAKFASNTTNSGVYAQEAENEDFKKEASFPVPETSRYKYTLVTEGDNPKPNVTVKFKLTDKETGNPVSGKTFSDLTFTDGYATWAGATNGTTIVFEHLPDNYKLEAVVENEDISGAYTYTLTVNGADKEFSAQDDEKPIYVTHVDSIIKVNSVANSRTVTIKEAVDNSAYASESDKFTPTVYLVPTGDVSVLSDTQRYGTWTLVEGTDYYTTDTVRAIQADSDDRIDLTIPAGWKLIVDQGSQNNYNVLEKNYTPENGNATQFSNGEEITINDNTTIVITNTRPSIPVEGINNSFNHNWIIYILVGITAIAVIAGGIYLWKNKDEFVEE